MYITSPGPRNGLVAALAQASPRLQLEGQHALIALIAGVTWLALIGGVLSGYILIEGSAGGSSHHSSPSYAAYDTQEVVPTSFGSLSVYRADLTSTPDSVEVHVSMRVDNNQDAQVDAPRLEDLRLLNMLGAEANAKPGAWSGPAVLIAHSSVTVDLKYLAPHDTGLLWLEYRDPAGQWPLRVALGTAQAPQPAAAVGLGDIR
jgi:hypothetical protein